MDASLAIQGHYSFVCIGADGRVKWTDEVDNLVTDVGARLILDQALAGASYTAAEVMGLISSTSFTAVSASDTMASHSGWLESGTTNAPTMSTARQTCAWSAAATRTKALSGAVSFAFTGAGTVQGAFIVGGAGAVSTVGNTAGTLISAAVISPTRAVITGDTLQVSYALTLT